MSNGLQIKVNAADLMRTVATLSALPRKIKNRPIRMALGAAGGVLKNDLPPRTPVRFGYLKKSYKVKVTQKKATKDWHVTVGIGRGRKQRFYNKRTKGKNIVPSRYLHLVENGSKGGGRRGHHMLRNAAAMVGPAAIAKGATKLAELINAEALLSRIR